MASHTREVLTFQIGNYSNFVGSHFWNIQDSSFVFDPKSSTLELNHDVMFREGLTHRGEVTYTPRLLIFDLKGSLGSLRQEGILYNSSAASDVLYQVPGVQVEQELPAVKNEFLQDLEEQDRAVVTENQVAIDYANKLYQLDDVVKVWSDYLRIHLHPKTVSLSNRYQLNSETEPFDSFILGQNLYKEPSCRDDFEDRIHFFAEECDSLQGFNIFVDTNNACSGLCCELIEDLNDYFNKKCIMTWGVSPPYRGDASIDSQYWLQNTMLSYVKLADASSAFIPLSTVADITSFPNKTVSLPYVRYRSDLNYHTSSLLALSVETAMLPFRLRSNRSSLAEQVSVLTPQGRTFLALSSAMPFAMSEDSTLFDTLLSHGDSLPWHQFTPNVSSSASAAHVQSIVLRGVKSSMLLNQNNPEILKLGPCNSARDMMDYYFRDVCSNTLTSSYDVALPTKITSPFPQIFDSHVADDGLISKAERFATQAVKSLPVMTSLQSTNAISGLLSGLVDFARKFPLHKLPRVRDAGLEEDEYKETVNRMESMRDNYCDDVDLL